MSALSAFRSLTLSVGQTPPVIQQALCQKLDGVQVIPTKTHSAALAAGLQGNYQSSTKTKEMTQGNVETH